MDKNLQFRVIAFYLGPILQDNFDQIKQSYTSPRDQEIVQQGLDDHIKDILNGRPLLSTHHRGPFKMIVDSDGDFLNVVLKNEQDSTLSSTLVSLSDTKGFFHSYWHNLRPFKEEKLPQAGIRQMFEEARRNTHREAGSRLMARLGAQGLECPLDLAEGIFSLLVYTYPDRTLNPSPDVHLRMARL